ncbi:DUF4231 domain-containing protein [Candidatus Halobeggiatoa sp. HSG11]|nr:DUF4231 domain-containing protein [Candidatus Halobeggiatoa sp. HSG11]
MAILDNISKKFKNTKKEKCEELLLDDPYQTITFPNKHSANLVKASSDVTPEQVMFKLPFTTPRSVIMMSGDTQGLDEATQQRLVQLFSRGLARTAINLDAVIIDNGKTSDLTTLIGQSIADRGYKSPLIGVTSSTQVNYPEQEEETKGTVPLEPNHTHFVLVDDAQHVTEFKYRLGEAMASQKAAIMILVNGDEEARAEVLQAVRMGWPIITVTGTGKLADEIAELSQNPPDFIPEPELAEIIADGQIIQFSVKGDVKELDRLIYRQLGGDNTLKLAWQQFAIYDKNATRQQKWFHHLQFLIIFFAVLGTSLVLLQATLDLQVQQSKIISSNRPIVENSCFDDNLKKIIQEYNKDEAEFNVETFCEKIKKRLKEEGKIEDIPKETSKDVPEGILKNIPEETLKNVLNLYKESSFIVQYLSKSNRLTPFVELFIIILQWFIVAIPIIITLLVGVSNHFSNGQKWIWLRSSAENLKSEIFRYRTKTGIYHNDKEREIEIAEKVKQLNSHLMQTEVKMSALKNYEGILPPQYSVAENDDGFTMLSPERYIKMRLADQLEYYQNKTAQLERKWTILQWCIYGLGGIGTLLAAREFELWIALTTGLVAALTTYLSYHQIEERLAKYNQAAVNLTNILNWWTALSTSEQMKQDMIDKLIASTETALGSEFNEWVKQMQETMMALKEQEEKSKDKDKKQKETTVQSPKNTEQDLSISSSINPTSTAAKTEVK